MRPAWVDDAEFPFASRFFDLGRDRLHYVDHGTGPPVVMVHGTPTWSFEYRHLIRGLAQRGYRCVVPDHLGFGLSACASTDDATYYPEAHAANLRRLIDGLALEDVTLIVHDFGGPIGLSYAIERPENVRRVLIMNTFMWATRPRFRYRLIGWTLGSWLGRFLYRHFNLPPRLMKREVRDKKRFTKPVQAHYFAPFPTKESRRPMWVMANRFIGSSAWFGDLWARRDRLASHPMQLMWGMKDRIFGRRELRQWRAALPEARVEELAGCGHFALEDLGPDLCPRVAAFLES